VAVPDRLLRLDDRDPASPELVQGGLRSEQLVDGVGDPLSMIVAWDIPAGRSSNEDRVPAKNGRGEIRTPETGVTRLPVFKTEKFGFIEPKI
jgi:hypothetical protein